jgi:hypothetical protein
MDPRLLVERAEVAMVPLMTRVPQQLLHLFLDCQIVVAAVVVLEILEHQVQAALVS